MKTDLPKSVKPGETVAGVQLCPFGEFPNGRTLQVCDEAAFNKLVEAFNAGGAQEVLCDFEHKSEDPSLTSDTGAGGRAPTLRNAESGEVYYVLIASKTFRPDPSVLPAEGEMTSAAVAAMEAARC